MPLEDKTLEYNNRFLSIFQEIGQIVIRQERIYFGFNISVDSVVVTGSHMSTLNPLSKEVMFRLPCLLSCLSSQASE